MIRLSHVKDLIKSIYPTADHYYSGLLNVKHEKSIGVYQRQNGRPRQCIGGQATYDVKHISVLVHWNKDSDETEEAALGLYDALKEVREETSGDENILFIIMTTDEPKDVGIDENGIYERVIWFDLYYEK